MSKSLRISDTLRFPLDTVTQSLAILAKRRAGKSYAGRGFAEQLLTADQQVVIIDPKGDWWGIRSGADAKSPGYPVVVLGGEHGDLPLEKTAAETIAHLIVEERVSVLLDLSTFRKSEVAFFLGGDIKQQRDGLLELIYRLKAKEQFRTPMMLITDEADAIAPQKPYPGEERMLGAMEDIVRRGGQRGIGSLLISQRSAVLNKNVLTQTQVMIAMRTIAEQDLDAIMGWVDAHGAPEQGKILKASLPALPTGDAWILSPGWPDADGIFHRIHFNPIQTFDSGATPKAGEKRVKPKNLADVDMGALERRMAATIERAKASDPNELKKRLAAANKTIAELEKRKPISQKSDTAAVSTEASASRQADRQKAMERGYAAGVRETKKAYAGQFAATQKAMAAIAREAKQESDTLDKEITRTVEHLGVAAKARNELALLAVRSAEVLAGLGNALEIPAYTPDRVPSQPERVPSGKPAPSSRVSTVTSRPEPRTIELPEGEITLKALHRAILTALAQHPKGLAKNQILLHAGYRASGDTSTAFAELLRFGLTENNGPLVVITKVGLSSLGDYNPLPLGSELLEYLLTDGKLAKVEKAVLSVLSKSYPDAIAKGKILEAANYKASGDTSTAFARLVRYGYAVKAPGGLKLATALTDSYEAA